MAADIHQNFKAITPGVFSAGNREMCAASLVQEAMDTTGCSRGRNGPLETFFVGGAGLEGGYKS